MDYEKKYKEALERARDFQHDNCWVTTIFPELKESEDERIRKELIEHIKANKEVGFVLFQKFSPDDVIAWLERQKVTDEEIIFRPVVGTDIRIAAKQALKKIDIGKKVVLAFNGAYILVNGKTVGEIDSEYDAWLKKQSDINETINRDEFAQGVLRGAAINLITWIDYNTAKGNMCLSNMECRVIEDALVNGDWDKIYAYIKRKLEKQSESKFKQCIQEGDKIVANDDGTHFNVSQLERTANKVAESKKTAKEFLKSAKIMDEDNKLADEYKLEKQGEQEEPQVYETEDGEIITYSETDGYKVVEPKFKVGDFIKHNKANIICKVIAVNSNNNSYYVENIGIGGSRIELYNAKQNFHLWTIKDAKDGDVIQLGEVTAIFKKYIGNENCICYCSFCEAGGFEIPIENGEDNVYGCYDDTIPATKEQRDLLFTKMNEAGYEWDDEKKELKKIHVIDEGKSEIDYCFTKMMNGEKISSAWSDEDEYLLVETIRHLEELIRIDKSKHFGDDVQYYQRDITWLKSLKERIKEKMKKL